MNRSSKISPIDARSGTLAPLKSEEDAELESKVKEIQKALDQEGRERPLSFTSKNHAKSLELLTDEAVTKRQTKIFEANVQFAELEKAYKKSESNEKTSSTENASNSPNTPSEKKVKNRLSKSIDNLFRKKADVASPVEVATSEGGIGEKIDSPAIESPRKSHFIPAASNIPSIEAVPYRRFRSYKEWLSAHSNDTKVGVFSEPKFQSVIRMEAITSNRENPSGMQELTIASLSQLLLAAKCYENAKSDQFWNAKIVEAEPKQPGEEIKYRILNIFEG